MSNEQIDYGSTMKYAFYLLAATLLIGCGEKPAGDRIGEMATNDKLYKVIIEVEGSKYLLVHSRRGLSICPLSPSVEQPDLDAAHKLALSKIEELEKQVELNKIAGVELHKFIRACDRFVLENPQIADEFPKHPFRARSKEEAETGEVY